MPSAATITSVADHERRARESPRRGLLLGLLRHVARPDRGPVARVERVEDPGRAEARRHGRWRGSACRAGRRRRSPPRSAWRRDAARSARRCARRSRRRSRRRRAAPACRSDRRRPRTTTSPGRPRGARARPAATSPSRFRSSIRERRRRDAVRGSRATRLRPSRARRRRHRRRGRASRLGWSADRGVASASPASPRLGVNGGGRVGSVRAATRLGCRALSRRIAAPRRRRPQVPLQPPRSAPVRRPAPRAAAPRRSASSATPSRCRRCR